MDAEEDAFDVDAEDLIEIGLGDGVERCNSHNASAQHQHAKLVFDRADQPVDIGHPFHVAGYPDGTRRKLG